MAGPSWLVDGNRFAMKIKSACDPDRVTWRSNPTKACPNCHYVIDNSDVAHDWPGLPRGVKFDPTDQEILWHLLAKVGVGDLKPHPFINEFIPTVESDDGICYTHPKNLPGVKQDGTVSHFFHRAIKAYNTGTRKRRKIQGDDSGDVRWHKTGKTKPVALDDQKGCKKIMVLYMSQTKGAKPEKTNWVMHQYHLGTGEDESEGEYVISKIFYQQQPGSKGDKNENNGSENNNPVIAKVDPVTPQSVTPDPSCGEGPCLELNPPKESNVANTCPDLYAQPLSLKHALIDYIEDEFLPNLENLNDADQSKTETQADQSNTENQADDGHDSQDEEENKWWESESQHLLDSQQLVEGLSLCDELLQSQSPARHGNGNVNERADGKPRLSDYAKLGPEDLKKDLEECQNLVLDPAAIEIDTPPEFRLSQLDFGSQDSVFAWSGNVAD